MVQSAMAEAADADALNAVFAALADPTRRAILARLGTGDCAVAELAQPFAMTAPAITKHLKVLEKAGLISRSRLKQARPCHLEPEPLRTATGWMEQYRQIWERRLQSLDNYLALIQKAPPQIALETIAISVPAKDVSSTEPANPPSTKAKP